MRGAVIVRTASAACQRVVAGSLEPRPPWTATRDAPYNGLVAAAASQFYQMSIQRRPSRIPLDRSVCLLDSDRIKVRASRSSFLVPLLGLLAGMACFASLVLSLGALPFAVVVLLVLAAIVLIPLSGMGLVYLLGGATVVVDRAKGSVVWQQGLLGLGVGTREVVPFSKIAQMAVEETTRDRLRGQQQDVAQWEIALVKTGGRRLRVGAVTVPRSLAQDGLERARGVAAAIAEMAGAPLSLPERRRRRARRGSAPARA
jgi:hypothetical protein